MNIFRWSLKYLSSTPVLLFLYLIPITASFLLSPSREGIEILTGITLLISLVIIVYIASKITQIYEYNQFFFFLSIPITIKRIIILFSISGFFIILPLSFVPLENSGITVPLNLVAMVFLYSVMYLFLSLAFSIFLRNFQTTTMLTFALSLGPLLASSYSLNNLNSYIPIFAISPFSGLAIYQLGKTSILTLWLPLYSLLAVITYISSLYHQDRRDLL